MRHPAFRISTFLICSLIGMIHAASLHGAPDTPAIPAVFAGDIPSSCRQVVLVLAKSGKAHTGRLWLLERQAATSPWRTVTEPVAVTLGRNGMAWGLGDHTAPAPADFRTKVEGDGCSPVGVFRLPFAFGYAPAAGGLSLPYRPMTSAMRGVDDSSSRYYNQIVDSGAVTPDWMSSETMRRKDERYRWGVYVSHNPRNAPGAGSCIFIHIWPTPGKGTSGCTAMAATDIRRVLWWLDPARQPRLVQGLAGW